MVCLKWRLLRCTILYRQTLNMGTSSCFPHRKYTAHIDMDYEPHPRSHRLRTIKETRRSAELLGTHTSDHELSPPSRVQVSLRSFDAHMLALSFLPC